MGNKKERLKSQGITVAPSPPCDPRPRETQLVWQTGSDLLAQGQTENEINVRQIYGRKVSQSMVTREGLEMGTITARSVNSKRDRKGVQTNSTNKAGKK